MRFCIFFLPTLPDNAAFIFFIFEKWHFWFLFDHFWPFLLKKWKTMKKKCQIFPFWARAGPWGPHVGPSHFRDQATIIWIQRAQDPVLKDLVLSDDSFVPNQVFQNKVPRRLDATVRFCLKWDNAIPTNNMLGDCQTYSPMAFIHC